MASPPALPSPSIATTDPTKAIGPYTLVFGWELALYESSMVGSGPEGSCTMNLNHVVGEPFFNSDLIVQLVGSTSDESDNVVEVKKIKKFSSSTNPENTPKTKGFQRTGVRPGCGY